MHGTGHDDWVEQPRGCASSRGDEDEGEEPDDDGTSFTLDPAEWGGEEGDDEDDYIYPYLRNLEE